MAVQPMSGQQMQQGGYVQNNSGYARDPNGPRGFPENQPHTSNTTVIINQPAIKFNNPMEPHTLRPWSTQLCGCMEDCGGCIFACCCPFYYQCAVASKQGHSCWGPCCVPTWAMAFRSHIRGVHSIEGGICNDCMVDSFCHLCSLCQMARELDNIMKGDARALPASMRG